MFEILKNPDYDIMGKRRIFLTLSAVAVLASIVLVAVNGVNPGIEFVGGAELRLRFADAPKLGQIRRSLDGLTPSTPVVTTIGDPQDHEVLIKLGTPEATPDERPEDLVQDVIDALRSDEVKALRKEKKVDLNVSDEATIAAALVDADVPRDEAGRIAEGILAQRKEVAIFHSLDDVAGIDAMSAQTRAALEKSVFIGPFSLRSQAYIGPVIGEELKRNSMLAIFGSLLGMLIYIWVRFQLQWGLAAVVALAHDTLIVLGLFSLFGKEMTLPVVAAFLTLVGYSINDTVVVLDRIRENIRSRGTRDFERVVNDSINQTLSRTIITSGSTWLVVMALLLFGGAALNAFAFVLSAGIVVGTYSSIFVASPILLMSYRFSQRRAGRSVRTPTRKAQAG